METNPNNTLTGYDTLYQRWCQALDAKDYPEADRIRDAFERLHGLTIFARGDMPIEGVTVRRTRRSSYLRKFGSDFDKKVADEIDRFDSFIKMHRPNYPGLL